MSTDGASKQASIEEALAGLQSSNEKIRHESFKTMLAASEKKSFVR